MRRLLPGLGLACMVLAAGCILNRAGSSSDGAGGAGAAGGSSGQGGGLGGASTSSSQGGMAGAGGMTTSSAGGSGGVGGLGGSGGGVLWPKEGYGARRPITIPMGNATGSHNNFPVLISIDRSTYSLTGMMTDGSDLLFTDDNGVDLSSEVDYVDNNVVLAWVKLPVLDENATTNLYVYYGNTNPPPTVSAQVWTQGYVSVYHLNENPGPNNAQMIDSVGNHDADTTDNMIPGDLVSTNIGRGLSFNGIDERLSVMLGSLTSGWTVSMWIQPTELELPYRNPSMVTTFNSMFDFWLRTEDDTHSLNLWSGNPMNPMAYQRNANLMNGQWQYIAVWTDANNSTARHYYNATSHTTGACANNTPDSGLFYIAGHNGFYYNGLIDELRFSSVIRNPNWTATEHANQSNPQGFITVGAEETP